MNCKSTAPALILNSQRYILLFRDWEVSGKMLENSPSFLVSIPKTFLCVKNCVTLKKKYFCSEWALMPPQSNQSNQSKGVWQGRGTASREAWRQMLKWGGSECEKRLGEAPP